MKKPLLLLSLLLLFSFGFSKSYTATVKGKVIDPDGEAVPFANVMLMSVADTSLAKAGLTGDDGTFSLVGVSPGNYFLRVTFSGLENYVSETMTLTEGDTKDLGTIQMTTPETQLEEVQIVAEKPLVTVKPDMTVFNVEGTINAIGEDAFALLRKAPGVMIDNNDNVMLLGKSGVRVMIDGKPSPLAGADLANFLKGMNSAEIESIEIITNPSAKYDAEGNAGIINIKLKKDKTIGMNGSVNAGYAIGRFSKYNGGGNINYRNKKFNAFASYSHNQGKYWNWMEFFRIQNGATFTSRTDMHSNRVNHNFKVGSDFFLNDKNTIGFMVNGFVGNRVNDDSTQTEIGDFSTGNLASILKTDNEGESNNNNVNVNLNYVFDKGNGTTLNMDLDYGLFRNDAFSLQPNFYWDPTETFVQEERTFRNVTPTNIDIYTFKTDYERKLLGGQLSAGVKVSYVATDNTFNFFNVVNGEDIQDDDRSNNFIYLENVNAAYLSFQRQVKKWNFQAGLRAEQTNSSGKLSSTQVTGNDTVNRNYLNLFPSGGVTFSPNRKNSFRLNYSRRIDRPRYEDLNPFLYNLNELSYRKGNPFLQPQYTHNLQFTHTFNYTLNTTLSYSNTQDFFTEIIDQADSIRSFMMKDNIQSRQVINLSVSYPFQITKWWSTYSNASVYHARNIADFDDDNKDIDLSRVSFSTYHQQTFKLPEDISIQLSGFYNSPNIWGANFLNEKFWGVEAGVQKQFWQGKANLKLSVSDIFRGMQWKGVQQFGDLYTEATGGWESRQFKVNFAYNFGSNQVKQARKRKTGLEDETGRATGGGGGR